MRRASGSCSCPPSAALGLFPPDAVGPQPIFAIGHSLLVLTLPSAAGLGALFLCAAIRTRGVAGPFACAATLMLVWMVAMVVVRGGDANPALASLLDPSAFAEAEEQSNLWTPREKAVGVLQMTPPLLANRLFWTLPPLLLLGIVLRRVERERLTLERAPAPREPDRAAESRAAGPADPGAPPIGAAVRPSWLGAAWSEAAWHFTLSFRGWATPLALLILAAMGVGGAFVHVVLHADGPLLPRPGFVEPMLVEFYYLVIVFMVAAFVGVMARRDDRAGYGEIRRRHSRAPRQPGGRPRPCRGAAVTVVFALTPAPRGVDRDAARRPRRLQPRRPVPLLRARARTGPAGAVRAGAPGPRADSPRGGGPRRPASSARSSSWSTTRWASPPTRRPRVGVPPSITLSELSGWAPWLGYLLTADLFKLAVAAALVGLAWLAWPRGTALTAPLRWRTGMGRLAGGAGALAAGAVALAIGIHTVLHEQLVGLGGYESAAAETADDAAWEARWWAAAAPFAVAGGEAAIEIDPVARRATARWASRRRALGLRDPAWLASPRRRDRARRRRPDARRR